MQTQTLPRRTRPVVPASIMASMIANIESNPTVKPVAGLKCPNPTRDTSEVFDALKSDCGAIGISCPTRPAQVHVPALPEKRLPVNKNKDFSKCRAYIPKPDAWMAVNDDSKSREEHIRFMNQRIHLDWLMHDLKVWREYAPLKQGVHHEFVGLVMRDVVPYLPPHIQEGLSKRVIRELLRKHCAKQKYTDNLKTCTKRYDLYGEVVSNLDENAFALRIGRFKQFWKNHPNRKQLIAERAKRLSEQYTHEKQPDGIVNSNRPVGEFFDYIPANTVRTPKNFVYDPSKKAGEFRGAGHASDTTRPHAPTRGRVSNQCKVVVKPAKRKFNI